MKTLIIDNYDSFTYNLVHLVEQFTDLLEVFRNDEIHISQIKEYDQIILSPGPGLPEEAGITMEVLEKFSSSKKILGVCLGLQAIAEAFGGNLVNLEEVMHGVSSKCMLENDSKLFNGMEASIEIGHYHSWAIDPKGVPDNFDITARNEDDIIMAMEHRELDICGVQFHPESVLTPEGKKIIGNWMK